MERFITIIIAGIVTYYAIHMLEAWRNDHENNEEPCSCQDKEPVKL